MVEVLWPDQVRNAADCRVSSYGVGLETFIEICDLISVSSTWCQLSVKVFITGPGEAEFTEALHLKLVYLVSRISSKCLFLILKRRQLTLQPRGPTVSGPERKLPFFAIDF